MVLKHCLKWRKMSVLYIYGRNRNELIFKCKYKKDDKNEIYICRNIWVRESES